MNHDDDINKEARELLEGHGFECCDFNAFIASLDIDCIEVIPPINSTVYCVRRADKQWAAFELGNATPIVPFGKYNDMWGFIDGYCKVSMKPDNLGGMLIDYIINEQGEEIIPLEQYRDIRNFL